MVGQTMLKHCALLYIQHPNVVETNLVASMMELPNVKSYP